MKRFTCCMCRTLVLATGGTVGTMCAACKPKFYTARQIAQMNAHIAVGRAVRNGLLPRASECQCADCGKPASEYDHRDYTRPLDVAPVCRLCNRRRGPALVWTRPIPATGSPHTSEGGSVESDALNAAGSPAHAEG